MNFLKNKYGSEVLAFSSGETLLVPQYGIVTRFTYQGFLHILCQSPDVTSIRHNLLHKRKEDT